MIKIPPQSHAIQEETGRTLKNEWWLPLVALAKLANSPLVRYGTERARVLLVATAVTDGTLYLETDTELIYQSRLLEDGSRGWVLIDVVRGAGGLTNVNRLTKVTAAGTIGESSITDNGTTVSTAEPVVLDSGATPARSQLLLQANALGALEAFCFAADNSKIAFDASFVAGNWVARDTSVIVILKNGDKLQFLGSAANVVGNVPTFNNLGALDLATGQWGFGNVAPAYAVDATGDVNASGVFRKGGTAGISVTITTAKLTPAGANGSMTFAGGILTAQTAAT